MSTHHGSIDRSELSRQRTYTCITVGVILNVVLWALIGLKMPFLLTHVGLGALVLGITITDQQEQQPFRGNLGYILICVGILIFAIGIGSIPLQELLSL